MATSSDAPIDYDGLMQANLSRVFSERDPGKRLLAIQELYADDAVLNDPQASVRGSAAISEAVSTLLSSLPPDFVFTATSPAVGHHGLGRLQWRGGPSGGPAVVTGTDIAQIEAGRIQWLHVFIDPVTG